MMKITTNKIKCKKCGDIIESIHVHDFKYCKCGAVAVDGGKAYLRRLGNRADWEEMSDYVTEEEEFKRRPFFNFSAGTYLYLSQD